jgi:hypothetical protein
MSLERIWAWLGDLDFPTVIVLSIALVFCWVQLCGKFGERPGWGKFWRPVGLFGPGIAFWVLSLDHTFTANQPGAITPVARVVVWLAWPILCYKIGHQDGKAEMQPKLDALYDALHEGSARR